MERLDSAGDPHRALLAAHQRVVEPRARQAAEDGRSDGEGNDVRLGQPRHRPVAIEARVGDAVVHDPVDPGGKRGHRGRGRGVDRSARDIAEIALDQRTGLGDVDVAGEDQDRVVGAVALAEPALHRLQRGGVKIAHRADRRVPVGMAFGEKALELGIFDHSVGLVVALALLVLDDSALVVQRFHRQCAEQVAHPVALKIERLLERRLRHGLEIIGAVEPGRAVEIGRAHRAGVGEVIARSVLGAVEHDVLEQVGEAGAAGGLVLRSDIVPDADRDHRGLVVLVDDDSKPVGEREGLVGDVDPGKEGGRAGPGARGGRAALGGGGRAGDGEGGRNSERGKNLAHENPRDVQGADTSAVCRLGNTLRRARPRIRCLIVREEARTTSSAKPKRGSCHEPREIHRPRARLPAIGADRGDADEPSADQPDPRA